MQDMTAIINTIYLNDHILIEIFFNVYGWITFSFLVWLAEMTHLEIKFEIIYFQIIELNLRSIKISAYKLVLDN